MTFEGINFIHSCRSGFWLGSGRMVRYQYQEQPGKPWESVGAVYSTHLR